MIRSVQISVGSLIYAQSSRDNEIRRDHATVALKSRNRPYASNFRRGPCYIGVNTAIYSVGCGGVHDDKNKLSPRQSRSALLHRRSARSQLRDKYPSQPPACVSHSLPPYFAGRLFFSAEQYGLRSLASIRAGCSLAALTEALGGRCHNWV